MNQNIKEIEVPKDGELAKLEQRKQEWMNNQRQKYNKQRDNLCPVIKCSCGNEIKEPRHHTERKCFACNAFHIKVSGKWLEQPRQPKNTMSVEDVLREKGITIRKKIKS